MKGIILLLILGLIPLLTGCEGDIYAPTTISISPTSATLHIGDTQQFSASGTNYYGEPVSFTPGWSVAGGIGSIDATGVFTATALGTGLVMATYGSVIGQAVVTISTADRSLTINASESAYVNSGQPNSNFSNEYILKSGMTMILTEYRSYIKFDLSTIPTQAAITSAKLHLYVENISTTETITIQINNPTSNWSESTLTWNNQPTQEYFVTSTSIAATGDQEIDITSIVSNWFAGAENNYGIQLKWDTGNVSGDVTFSGRRNLAHRPYLIVGYNY